MRSESVADADVARLGLALDRIIRLLRRADLPGDLSPAAASVLYTLVNAGPCRLTTLAEAEHVSQPAMTQLIGRLEQAGLVTRTPDEEDRRAVLIAATGTGRELGAARRAARAEKLAELVGRLDPADAARLSAAVPSLERVASIGDAEHPAPESSESAPSQSAPHASGAR